LGRTPCRDQRLPLRVPELRFVLALERSKLIPFSPEPYVDTDWRDGARGRCSGVPNWNATDCGLDGGSVSALSVDTLERDKLVRFIGVVIGITTGFSTFAEAVEGPTDVQRFRGGGCNERAPRDNARFALVESVAVVSLLPHRAGCRSGRILRSNRRSVGPEKGRIVRDTAELGGVLITWFSGVFERSIFSKLLPMLAKDSSPTSRSWLRSESMDAALEGDLGREEPVKRLFNAETAPPVEDDLGAVAWERIDCDEMEAA